MVLFFRKKKPAPESTTPDNHDTNHEVHQETEQEIQNTVSTDIDVTTDDDDKAVLDEGLKKSSNSLLSGLSGIFSSGITFSY